MYQVVPVHFDLTIIRVNQSNPGFNGPTGWPIYPIAWPYWFSWNWLGEHL